MKRFESLSSLQTDADARRLGCNARPRSRSVGESSAGACVVRAPESNWLGGRRDSNPFVMLEQQIDSLNELFVEQCKLHTKIKTDISNARSAMRNSELARNKHVTELLQKVLSQSQVTEIEDVDHTFNSRARSLLDAIETKHGFSLDREIREALAEFLQSDELRQHMVSAAEQTLLSVVNRQFTRDVSVMFVSILQHSQKRMAKHLVRVLQSSFSECELLGKELKKWREQAIKVKNAPTTVEACDDELKPESLLPLDHANYSSQSVSNSSIVDQLMTAAEITKQIEDGDINGAFSRALSAGDLPLVTAACRAAEPRRLRALPQPVLLSLAQQLATDLVKDTQLKCRYLEETLLHLDPLHPATREHLQLLITEVLAHLGRFLRQYPEHAERQRVELIIVTAYQLNMKNLDKSNL